MIFNLFFSKSILYFKYKEHYLGGKKIKFYNKTRCSDRLLSRLLIAAGRSVGARTTGVVVKVTQGHRLYSRGVAYSGWPYQWHLKHVKTEAAKNRTIDTDGGWIEIVLPRLFSLKRMECWSDIDAISLAEKFWETAQHEWAHILDFQQRTYKSTPRTSSGRRIRWAERPCEIFAMEQVDNAKVLYNRDDVILALAEWIEKDRELV